MQQLRSKPPHPLPIALGALIPKRRPAPDALPPELSLRIERLEVDGARLAAFRELCGFPATGSVPLPYLFVLGFHAQAALLVQRSFPLSALGMVHTRCRLESLEPIDGDDELALELRLAGWRRVRRGREVDVDCLYLRDGKEVARGRQTSLSLGGGTGEARPTQERSGPPDGSYARWRLPADIGRRYAKVSGDYNPIHLWPATARPLGFRRAIAHGMYLVSRAVAELGTDASAPSRLDVRFKTPAELPADVRSYHHPDDDGARGFELWRGDGERPHVTGRLVAT